MKAISLYEPWATLIALGKKRFETRSWSTAYRGPLLICASVKHPPIWKIIDILYRSKIHLEDCKPGRAVCIVDLVDIYRTETVSFWTGMDERIVGDWSPGRFAWKFKNVLRFKNPPSIRGRQGLFDIDDELIKSLDTYEPI